MMSIHASVLFEFRYIRMAMEKNTEYIEPFPAPGKLHARINRKNRRDALNAFRIERGHPILNRRPHKNTKSVGKGRYSRNRTNKPTPEPPAQNVLGVRSYATANTDAAVLTSTMLQSQGNSTIRRRSRLGPNLHPQNSMEVSRSLIGNTCEENNNNRKRKRMRYSPSQVLSPPRTSSIATDSTHTRKCYVPLYIGLPVLQCEFCEAFMWYEEKVRSSKENPGIRFNQCCRQGLINIPRTKPPPTLLKRLLSFDRGGRSAEFREHIRIYNSYFQFTSIGGKIDNDVNKSAGPYVFKLSGQNHHRIGSLLPIPGQRPKFAQIYMVETESELQCRTAALASNNNNNSIHGIDVGIILALSNMFSECNEIVKVFRTARQMHSKFGQKPIKIRLLGSRNHADYNYSAPTTPEIAAIIVGDIGISEQGRDVIIEHRSEGLKRISELHPLFMPLQYPLLFPYGEDSFRLDIPYVDFPGKDKLKRQHLTIREYYAFVIQQRFVDENILLRGGRLLQQFIVDCYAAIEENNLRYIRQHQQDLRSEMYKNVRDALSREDMNASSIGCRIVLPASFIPGPRYLFEKYHDAMAICRFYGYPNLFITFTCNPKWQEIRNTLKSIRGQRPEDRPDIVSRVFRIKLKYLVKDLMKKKHFGPAKAIVYTVEFQKRGLPHVHILLWLENNKEPLTAAEIDKMVSAELPDKEIDPVGYAAVSEFMIHGPCGTANLNSPCMQDGKCKKFYPKEFQNTTTIDEDGFPRYKRRDLMTATIRNGIELDNRYVVAHNVDLVVRYQAHINVEICNRTRAVKYLFKYISKGPDRSRAVFESTSESNKLNEIQNYVDCRYLSAYESCWRLFEFPIHYRRPAVQRLLLHLPDEHNIYFSDWQTVPGLMGKPDLDKTMFTEWMHTNQIDPRGRSLLYADFPTKYTWKVKKKRWQYRKSGSTIGRIVYIHPKAGELYYLRLMINEIKGAKNYQDLRTVNQITYQTYRQACFVMGLLGDDTEWSNAITQAAQWATGLELRQLFVTILLFCEVGDKKKLYEDHWRLLSEDISYRMQKTYRMPNYRIPDDCLKNYLLVSLQEIFLKHASSLEDNDLPQPLSLDANRVSDRLYQEELSYNVTELQREYMEMLGKLNSEQLEIHNEIMEAVHQKKGGMFFVYGHGGTGKTFLWTTIILGVRAGGQIVLAVASSGIASLLLPGGRTAHSRFNIPLNINECSTCRISKQTQLSRLLIDAALIVWDEAPMIHRHCFEALNKSMQDILSEIDPEAASKPFGGKPVVLGGDFRQILPVIQHGSKLDILNATVTNSTLWKHCKVFQLKTNMRLQNNNLSTDQRFEILQFAQWLLKVGEGKCENLEDENRDTDETWIEIPSEQQIQDSGDPVQSMIDAVYPEFNMNYSEPDYLRSRAIITPFNDTVDRINEQIAAKIDAPNRMYHSSDYLSKSSHPLETQGALYPTEFLNTLTFTGIPDHQLCLKIGSLIMLMRNISQANGLCNGTRLLITQLCQNVLEARIISGSNIGTKVYIPRITMTSQNSRWTFIMCRKQFPVRISYCMTINKSQGQTLDLVGLYLPRPVFSHGQLYVALSRVTSKTGLKILALDEYGDSIQKTKNVVFKEVFLTI